MDLFPVVQDPFELLYIICSVLLLVMLCAKFVEWIEDPVEEYFVTDEELKAGVEQYKAEHPEVLELYNNKEVEELFEDLGIKKE